MSEFRVDDRVYYPTASTEVLIAVENDNANYPIAVRLDEGSEYTFTENGLAYKQNKTPLLFHATEENYELLSKLYPDVKFEPPPKRKTPRETIQAMLDDGWKQIPCFTSDFTEIPVDLFSTDLLVKLDLGISPYICTGSHWRYAQPFDPKTGKTIIDYVDGEVVLED